MKKTTLKMMLFAAAFFFALCSIKAQTTGTMIGSVTQPCNNNGQITVTVTGLTPPINYTYNNWMVGVNIAHSGVTSTNDALTSVGAYHSPWGNANVWQVTASDGTNTASGSFTLTPPFTFADSLHVGMCPAQSTVEASAFAGGSSPYTCVWTNQNTSISYTANPAAVPNGPYSLVVTDNAGCIVSTALSGSFVINVYSGSSMSLNVSGTSANCTNGTATVTASGGSSPYSYLWSNSATTPTLSGLTTGNYTCLVTDNVGCQSVAYHFVPQAVNINLNPVVTNATCLQNNGSIMTFPTGGTAPYTFNWSNFATTSSISGVPGGTMYGVQVTDANSCTKTTNIYVSVTTPINVTYVTAASACTAATGAATITASGGTTPYSIQWFTSPSITTGASITNKPAGSYSFKVTDNAGCVRTGVVPIPNNSTLNASISGGAVVCPATTGNLAVTVTGMSGPFTYSWSNSATTATLTGVSLGTYYVTITDAIGCKLTKSGTVGQVSPVFVGVSSTPVDCIFSANGSATANATGGTGPYSYAWSGSMTGATISGLTKGQYYVTATDANGCKGHATANVGNSATSSTCYCTITGTVYSDVNANCTQNSGETGLQNIQIHCSGMGYAYTNANGVYSFQVPTGNYTITESVLLAYPLAPCQSNNQPVSATTGASNCLYIVNFANTVTAISDLHIITSNINLPIPGNGYQQKVIILNDGTQNENTINFSYKHDGQLPFISSSPWTLTQPNSSSFPNWYAISSGFTMAPGAWSQSVMQYSVPANIPLSTNVTFYDTVAKAASVNSQWLNDNSPWNNLNNHNVTVVGSYDPNFKEVSPQGQGPNGNITSKDSILTYVVHFQNTGSYFAQNIAVVDSIDSDLNLLSLRPGYSDHNFTAEISETGVAKFTFKNINLPWKSTYGDALSSGMFTYSIKMKKGLAPGTQIKNRAAIYFDYNQPIITNTTLNTLTAPTNTNSIEEMKGAGAEKVVLFPNPASNYFTVLVNADEHASGLLNIYDISGRQVSSKLVELVPGDNRILENTAHLQNGLYLVQLKADNIQTTERLIITR